MLINPGNEKSNKSAVISAFYGLNRTENGGAGEMAEMKNMSSFEFPFAAPRGARVKLCDMPGTPAAVAAPDSTDVTEPEGFTGVCGGKFWYNGVVKSGTAKLREKYKWGIVRFGRLYVINGFSDSGSVMYSYNPITDEFTEAGTIMDSLIVTAGKDSTGNYLATIRYGYDEVREYSFTDSDGELVENEAFFDKYTGGSSVLGEDNIFEEYFAEGDTVSISGFPSAAENIGQVWSYTAGSGTLTVQKSVDYSANNTVDTEMYASLDLVSKYSITGAQVKSFKTTAMGVGGVTTHIHYMYLTLTDKNGDTLNFDTMSGQYCTGVRIEKDRRAFRHIAVHQGRLWGTSPYGNYIYASASDDIFSFSAEDIVQGFAARLTSDTEGGFTALAEYNNELYAFKDNSITVIGGTNVSNYNTCVINGIGCIDGASAAVTADGIIFLSHKGFSICSGTRVTRLSERLRTKYISAVCGTDGDRYYASAKTDEGDTELLAYDLVRGLWHTEDDTAADGFFNFRGSLYMAADGEISRITECEPEDLAWELVTCPSELGLFDNKAVNELWIRARVTDGAQFCVYTSVDGGAFAAHGTYDKAGLNLFRIPVRAVAGTDFRIKITGTGRVVIRAIEIKADTGGRKIRSDKR